MATAAEIMTKQVVTVGPDAPLREVAALLAKERFGSVPVVDAVGHVLGIVTEEDMVQRAAEIHLPRHVTFLGGIIYLENPQRFEDEAERILATTAGEIMDRGFVTVRPDTPVDVLAARMLELDARRLVVLDDTARLLGIITRADIVRMYSAGGRLPDVGEERPQAT